MILSDGDIEAALLAGELDIEPWPGPKQIQPASVDLTLAGAFVEWKAPVGFGRRDVVDVGRPLDPHLVRDVEVSDGGSYHIRAGGFALASTVERVRIGAGLVGRIEGRSSLGRLGVIVHATAGYVDPGFDGQLTLEILNVNPNPVALRVGMRIAQLSFLRLASPARRPYSGKYQGQRGPTASRIDRDFGG